MAIRQKQREQSEESADMLRSGVISAAGAAEAARSRCRPDQAAGRCGASTGPEKG